MKTNLFVISLLIINILSACTTAITSTYTPTPNVAPTSTPTDIPTPIVKQVQEFLVFHDFNTNEVLDKEFEYPVENIEISTGDYSCISDSDGICTLEYYDDIAPIKVNVKGENINNFGYVFYSNKTYLLNSPFNLVSTEKTFISIGLGQGPFAVPLNASSIGHYFDGTGNYGQEREDGTHHYAVDIRIIGDKSQPIYAIADGRIDIPDQSDKPCGFVLYIRKDYGDFNVNYWHITDILVQQNQEVTKGEIVGMIHPSLFDSNISHYNDKGEAEYTGPNNIACTNNPHLHLGIYGPGGKEGEGGWGWLNILELLSKSNEFYTMKE
jgi:hypothetical protein